jgi:hypothetical protein
MHKPLVFALLLSTSGLSALAQGISPTSSVAAGQYQYCTLVTTDVYGRRPVLDYGQHAKHAIAIPELDQLNQELEKLDSGMLALTYLCNHGWEYVAATTLSPGVSAYNSYLLRRRIQ